jgi:hypothetical protein
MPDRIDRRTNMPDAPEESAQQEVAPLGDRLKMSEARLSRTRGFSTSSSSPTAEVSESVKTNGSSSETTPIAPVVNLASWLSSPEAERFFTSPLPPEQVQDFQVRLNITTFGRESHMHKTVASMLRELHVKGLHVDSAYITVNGEQEEVTEKYQDSEGRKWYDTKYNGAVVLTENPIDAE